MPYNYQTNTGQYDPSQFNLQDFQTGGSKLVQRVSGSTTPRDYYSIVDNRGFSYEIAPELAEQLQGSGVQAIDARSAGGDIPSLQKLVPGFSSGAGGGAMIKDYNAFHGQFVAPAYNERFSRENQERVTAANLAAGNYVGPPQLGTPSSGTPTPNPVNVPGPQGQVPPQTQTGVPQPGGTGATGQPYVDPNASGATYTPPGTGNANNAYYKDAQGNVFRTSDNKPVTMGNPDPALDWNKLGLNVTQINTKQQLDSRTGGQKESERLFDEGLVTTAKTPTAQNDFFKSLQGRMVKNDEMIANLLAAGEKSKERKDLEKTAGDLVSSYEAGLTDLYGEVIPMNLILGGALQLERQANDKLNAVNRTLERLQGNQEAQTAVLEKAYDLNRNSLNDMIAFYNLTKPENLGFNSETGELAFYNPMTQEVMVKKAPGYTTPNEFKYVDLGNRVAVLDKNGKEVDSFTKGKVPSDSGGFGNYSEDQLKVITKINQDVSKNATYAKTSSMRNYADNVVAALALGTGTSDIAAINQFQKVIDEGAVTRDQDVVLIQGAQSLVNTLQTKIKGLQEGDKLSATQRNEMRDLVEKLYTTQVKALNKDPYIAAKTKEAGLYKLTVNDTILGELGGFDRGTNTVDTYINNNVGNTNQTDNQEKSTTVPVTDWFGSIKSWLYGEK